MSNRTREIKRRVKEALEEEGATSLFFSILNNSHQRYDFQVDGERGWFTFASTPRSSQAVVNAAMAARRAVRRRREEAALKRSEAVEVVTPRFRAVPGSRLAQLRAEAHRALDVHWEFGGATRSQAYSWLASKLGLPEHLCHIGMFGERECERAIAVCRAEGPKVR